MRMVFMVKLLGDGGWEQMEGGATISGQGWINYNQTSNFCLQESDCGGSPRPSDCAAAAARRVLQGDQRRGRLGRALWGVRQSELLHHAGRPVRAGRGGARAGDAGGWRLRADASGARGHPFGRGAAPHRLPAPDGEHGLRHGLADGPPDMRMLGGYFEFDSPDAALRVSLLPDLLHVRGVERLPTLVQLVRQECLAMLPGRDLVLDRLVELLLIEALRSSGEAGAPPGLLRGLADARVAVGLRLMHSAPEQSWTVDALAREAALSRSTFFERFLRAVGVPPMEYLLAWRMALAKNLLRGSDGRIGIDEVAARVGYSSASTFSTAFSRHVGLAPGR